MPRKSSLILIGYRGTGKSSVARGVAERCDVEWYDSDTAVHECAGVSIATIFEKYGEGAFRDLEEVVIADLLQMPSCVFATGGGAILRETTRARLRKAGTVVWLTATPATIFERITTDPHSATTRPPLTTLAAVDEITSVLETRRQLYEQTAHVSVATDHKTLDAVIDQVIQAWKERG